MQKAVMALKEHGCDVEGALNRMLNDENFLMHCVHAALDQAEYEQLGDALRAQKAKEVFEYAHALKGVTANVGLTPLYDTVVEIVEPLRAGNAQGLMPLYDKLLAQRDELRRAVAE